MSIILIGGGTRSGKSSFGLARARRCGDRLAFIATAEALDHEMSVRIQKHREDRGPEFVTYEEPHAISELITSVSNSFDAIVVDCLTLWLSNLLLGKYADFSNEYKKLIDASLGAASPIILITNEVGCGIVPDNELSRQFRDEAGRLNQSVAAVAKEIYWMVFGIPLCVKESGFSAH